MILKILFVIYLELKLCNVLTKCRNIVVALPILVIGEIATNG